jgi:hypothetical protein
MSNDDIDIVTEFETNEQVFVPAGDDAPACWKQRGDLSVGEFVRYARGVMTPQISK